MIPIWLILSVRGLGLLAERLAVMTRSGEETEGQARALAPILASPIFLSFLLAWSPWRVADSYDCKILNDSTGAFRFVRFSSGRETRSPPTSLTPTPLTWRSAGWTTTSPCRCSTTS